MTLPTVTLETDLGDVELMFGYRSVGDPAYSDVPAEGPWCPTESEAEHYGARLIAVGNWLSFRVEKRYVKSLRTGTLGDPPITPKEKQCREGG